MSRQTIPTGFTPGPRHKVFGISDDLLNTTRNILMGLKPEAKEAEESEEEADENKQALTENEGRFVKHTNTDYDSLGHPIKPLPIPKKKKKPTSSGIKVPSPAQRANMDWPSYAKSAPGIKNEALSHNCANHVKSEQWGAGQCIPGMHTIEQISEDVGIVTHYDVMFEHGIEEDVPVEDLEIVSEKHHSHKKSMKEDDDNDDGNGDDDENGNGKSKKKSKKSKKLDKVDPDELEGSHDERDDEDIDNDGDEDDSDEYLHKRRKAIHKATKKDA